MTTTHDTNPTESASTYYDADPTESVRTDNEPQTTASAWSSSPLGQLDHEVRFGFAQTGATETIAHDEPRPDRKKAILAAALAAGVIAGSGIGVMLFDYGDSGQPTVVVPRSEERLPSPPVAPPIPPRPPIDVAPAPNPVAPPQRSGQAPVAPPASGLGPADVATPPAGTGSQPTVVVEIPIPDFPPLPEKPQEDPEPEPPQPPDVPDLDFKWPVPPAPEPDPPIFAPDLQLAPFPQPQPQPDPPGPPIFVPPVKAGP
jgi:hypothetical protein